MAKRENCEHRHANGNCLFNGGFCLANDEEHCVRIIEIKSYNQALEDFEAYAQKWADRQECIGRKVVKLVVNELIDSAKELKK